MAAFSVFRLSCGEPLLSNDTISNCGAFGFVLLSFSAENCQLFSWFWPTLAKGPDSGSMKAIFTVSACAASAMRRAPRLSSPRSVLKRFMMSTRFGLQILER